MSESNDKPNGRMTAQLITNVRLVEPGCGVRQGELLIRDGRIAAPGSVPPAVTTDGRGALLTPGLMDVHTHGILHSVYECGPEALRTGAAALGRFGVTCIVPTMVPLFGETFLQRLEQVADALPTLRGVRAPGLHLEGPFLALAGAGCATAPGDLGLLDELFAACRGQLRVMSVSPETANILPVIERLRERKVRVFLTHTRATVEQTQAAIDAGATHATHFYDVFPAPAETDPGVRAAGAVETMLADPRTTVDFVADGVHVHPMAIRAAVRAKGFEGVLLVTDSVIGAGLPPGIYDTPWGFRVRVTASAGARHAEDNCLAGSVLTMNRGMANLMNWLALPPEQVWAMGTSNPARLLGLAPQGTLAVGAPADLVLWDENLAPIKTWVGGECVYTREEANV